MRSESSIVHVDLDAFFASVEQRDKPSLRGRPVIVGGIGGRGVVSTASYEARVYGARSAMSTAEARAICPAGTAFLWPRFEAYRKSSLIVMEELRALSPMVEQVSIDEAYIDLRGAGLADLSSASIQRALERLTERISQRTGGLTASAGAASSKMMAKVASELKKPAGISVIEPGTEEQILGPMSVRALAGVGPATAARLRTFGIETVEQLRGMQIVDLTSIFGERHGNGLYALARAQDDRELTLEREAKSVSAEETFERDIHDRQVLAREVEVIAESVARRLRAKTVFGRTVHLKVRLPDFQIQTRSLTLTSPTDEPQHIADVAKKLLSNLELPQGVRLIGVGVSGFVKHSQSGLFDVDDEPDVPAFPEVVGTPVTDDETVDDAEHSDPGFATRFTPGEGTTWRTGMDVVHPDHGAGWVWGAGKSRVTVRFEGPTTPPGPVVTFDAHDAALVPADPPSWESGDTSADNSQTLREQEEA